MASKLSRFFLKYFHYTNIFSGFVFVKCDFRQKIVKTSKFRVFYSALWSLFFVVNFYHATYESYGDQDEIYKYHKAVGTTAEIEMFVTYVAIISIFVLQFRNARVSVEFFNRLIKLTKVEGFHLYDPLFDSLGRQVAFLAAFGEVFGTYLYLYNFFGALTFEVKKILSLNPFSNLLLSVYLMILPITVVSRFSIFIAFCIDIIRQVTKILNRRTFDALILARNPENWATVHANVQEIDQLYTEVLKVVKLFERSFGRIIIILQVLSLFIGINQVN